MDAFAAQGDLHVKLPLLCWGDGPRFYESSLNSLSSLNSPSLPPAKAAAGGAVPHRLHGRAIVDDDDSGHIHVDVDDALDGGDGDDAAGNHTSW